MPDVGDPTLALLDDYRLKRRAALQIAHAHEPHVPALRAMSRTQPILGESAESERAASGYPCKTQSEPHRFPPKKTGRSHPDSIIAPDTPTYRLKLAASRAGPVNSSTCMPVSARSTM